MQQMALESSSWDAEYEPRDWFSSLIIFLNHFAISHALSSLSSIYFQWYQLGFAGHLRSWEIARYFLENVKKLDVAPSVICPFNWKNKYLKSLTSGINPGFCFRAFLVEKAH